MMTKVNRCLSGEVKRVIDNTTDSSQFLIFCTAHSSCARCPTPVEASTSLYKVQGEQGIDFCLHSRAAGANLGLGAEKDGTFVVDVHGGRQRGPTVSYQCGEAQAASRVPNLRIIRTVS